MRIVPLFLAFNMVFFCIPMYLAWKQKKSKAIAVIKSLYLQFFNLGIILLLIFRLDENSEAQEIFTISMIAIIAIGAVHEVL